MALSSRLPIPLAPLIPTDDPDEFKAAPIGRCVVGTSFAIWCHAADLQGSILWGPLDERSIRDMIAIGEFIEHPALAGPRRTLTDCSDLERADADVVLGFVEIARERVGAFTRRIERQVMIVPPGLHGLMIAGALPSASVEHRLHVTQDLDAALTHLDHPAAAAAHAAASRIVAATRGTSALLSRLRAHLARNLDSSTIESSATALGMSTRTLQRELSRLHTSFSDELLRARIAAAQALLVYTDQKIEAIASQIGFGTASRMSAWLRRELNRTASELRSERRIVG